MSVKKEGYVDRPAGKDDSFTIHAVAMKEYFDEQSKEDKATKKNAKTVAIDSVKREVLSTELEQGMTIRAENGGKPQTRSGETR